jgi:histidinol phosphatase-like enzyme
MARLTEALGIDIAVCPHGAGPPTCWCRTPLPGLAVGFVVRHGLDPAQTLFVGKAAADKTLAERMGFAYLDHEAFFNPGA